jgi:integrase
MPRLSLRPAELRTLPAGPDGERVSYYDTDAPGLVLRVGGPEPRDRVWYFEYSMRGRSRRMRLGDLTDDKTLSERRGEAKRYRGWVSDGRDPLDEKEAAEAAAEAAKREAANRETFAALGERALAAMGKKLRPKTMADYRGMWKNELLPAMGHVDARDPVAVKRAALKMADRLVAREKLYGANRCLSLACSIMSYAVDSDRDGLYPANPLFRMKKPFREEEARTRVYSHDELRAIVPACVGTLYEDVVPLLLATGARAGEVLSAAWREFDGNTWTIPAAQSKIDHDRPAHLSCYALEVLARVRERSGSGFLFPAPTKSGHRERMQKVVYKIRAKSGVADFRLHDFRRELRTELIELGVPTDVCELAIGHLPSKLVRTYAPHPTFWRMREQRPAIEAWGARLERILAGEEKRTADVLPMVRTGTV